MNLPTVYNGETGGKAGAVDLGGSAHAAPANFTVGHVGFGPCWEDDEVCLTDKGWKTITDSMAASIIRLEQEKQELVAEVALAEAERIELAKQLRSEREMHAACQNERDALAESVRESAAVTEGRTVNTGRSDLSRRHILETVAFLRKFNLWRRGGYDQQPPCAHEVGEAIDSACDHIERMDREIESLRDALCADKCRDKAAADGGWANI